MENNFTDSVIINENDSNQETSTKDIMVAHQAVFDRNKNIWGYEMLYRTVEDNAEFDGEKATISVILDGISLIKPRLKQEQNLLINFPQKTIIAGSMSEIIDKRNCVIEILEDTRPTPEVIEALFRLNDEGHTLAVDDYSLQPHLDPILPYVSIIKVEIPDFTAEQIVEVARKFSHKTLLAEKVEDQETYKVCYDAGYDLFQGYYFRKPEIIAGKKPTISQITRMQLISELNNPDFDMNRISRIFQQDVSLSYKLLRYLNSAAIGMQSKITSLKRAVTTMGSSRLKHWLGATLINDLHDGDQLSSHTALLAAHRGKFLSLTAEFSNKPNLIDTCYMLGLFSLLETLLGVPFAEIFNDIPVDDQISRAITEGDGKLADWLHLLENYETGDWQTCEEISARINVSKDALVRAYKESLSWSQGIFEKGEESVG